MRQRSHHAPASAITLAALLVGTLAQDRSLGVSQRSANPTGYYALVIGNNDYRSL